VNFIKAEITVGEFIEVLQAHYDEPLKEFKVLVQDWGLKPRLASEGYIGDERDVQGISVAVVKAIRANDIYAKEVCVDVPVHQNRSKNQLIAYGAENINVEVGSMIRKSSFMAKLHFKALPDKLWSPKEDTVSIPLHRFFIKREEVKNIFLRGYKPSFPWKDAQGKPIRLHTADQNRGYFPETSTPDDRQLSDSLSVFRDMDNLIFSEITLEFTSDTNLNISARGVKKSVHLAEMRLYTHKSQERNVLGDTLYDIALNYKLRPKGAGDVLRKRVSSLRTILKTRLGIQKDNPFQEDWKPNFKVINRIKMADDRARVNTTHVPFNDNINYANDQSQFSSQDNNYPYDDEFDEAGEFLRGIDGDVNSP
jgi:hypothetical protein